MIVKWRDSHDRSKRHVKYTSAILPLSYGIMFFDDEQNMITVSSSELMLIIDGDKEDEKLYDR